MADYLVQVLKDRDAVARAAADFFVNLAPQPQGDKRPFLVVLAGGTTPQALYALLASAEYRNRVAWDQVSFFFGDERAVPPDHPDSNYRTAQEALFRPLNISEKHIYRLKAEQPDLEAVATDYERALRSVFDGEQVPRFDLIFLGMGPDGHTASLFPGHPALAERKRWVTPVLDAPKPPPRRLTLTVPVLNAAKLVLFMATGADKALALREVLEGNASPDQYPAKHVRPGADRLVWLVDEAAGGTLSKRHHA
jgi:6-phosphogluconolactonase